MHPGSHAFNGGSPDGDVGAPGRRPLTDMFDLPSSPWIVHAVILVIAGTTIGIGGVKLASLADRLADRTGLGEAITGTVFLGLTTALPGLAASVTAAWEGRPALAISNAIGGIAIQTAFLAIADVAHLKANLEHAAASVANMIQTTILLGLLVLTLLGLTGPDVTVLNVHPVTIGLLLAAVCGFGLVIKSSTTPMWTPRVTSATVEDIPDKGNQRSSLGRLLAGFATSAVVVTAAGAAAAHSSGVIAEQTGLSDTVAGGLLSGVATSLPELVTTVAAVRRGALTLAVSDIVGGNFFDVLFVCAADLIYMDGSLYHAVGVGPREAFLTGLAIALNIVLLLGLLYRQRSGPGNIGFESLLILVIYVGGFLVISTLM